VRAVCNFNKLLEDIVARSSGVFLWVRLVVSDLQRAVADENPSIADVNDRLIQTLASLPD